MAILSLFWQIWGVVFFFWILMMCEHYSRCERSSLMMVFWAWTCLCPSGLCLGHLIPTHMSSTCSLWTKRCAAFGHTVWGCYYINFGEKLIYTARLWARILRASEAIWAAILAQMPQNFSHMYLHMSSNRYVSRFYEQSSRWPKLMTINSTAQPIETHGKLAGVFP